MLSLYGSLALLGLSAVDPVGIGIMPVLLVQKKPYERVFVFLSGSFVALMGMGLLYAAGIGALLLRFEQANPWLIPTVERCAGVILLLIAVVSYARLKAGKMSVALPKKNRGWLTGGNARLFTLGALLVAVQSVIDVVFVVAMVRIGQFKLSGLALVGGVATYATAALCIQLVVVAVFHFAPPNQKKRTLKAIEKWLNTYSNQLILFVSLALGVALLLTAH